MQVKNLGSRADKAKFLLIADLSEISQARDSFVKEAALNLKIDGFRDGKAPINVVLKHLDPNTVQTETLNRLINRLYKELIDLKELIPVGQPAISIKKFVPYDQAEVEIEVDVIGKLKIPDYHKINIPSQPKIITSKEINGALEELRKRAANLIEVKDPAKNGDTLEISFIGKDFKTKEEIKEASSPSYLLTLGSNTFIPGFEDKLIGLKEGQTKDFDLTFPSDYFQSDFKSRKVSFFVKVLKVKQSKLDTLDDKFAAKVGPFKSLAELKDQIKKELVDQSKRQAEIERDNKILDKLADLTTCSIPKSLIEAEESSLRNVDLQTAERAGLSIDDFIRQQKLTKTKYDNELKKAATNRIKIGLAIVEIAKKENIKVTKEEVQAQIEILKTQYQDPKMQQELDSDNFKNEITKRLLTDKVLAVIKK